MDKKQCDICQKETETFCGLCDVGICSAEHWSEHCAKPKAKDIHYKAYEREIKRRKIC